MLLFASDLEVDDFALLSLQGNLVGAAVACSGSLGDNVGSEQAVYLETDLASAGCAILGL